MTTPRKPARRTRTPSHEPPPREPDGSASGPADAVAGLLGAHGEPVVIPVTNNGHAPDGKFTASNGIGHRFEKGNKFGRGNPNARRIHELRQMFLEAVEPETVVALAKRLQVQALSGDMDAMKMLLDHAIGRPQQALELTGPDGAELGINVGAITTVVLAALSGPEHAEARVRIAADLMRIDDARDDDA